MNILCANGDMDAASRVASASQVARAALPVARTLAQHGQRSAALTIAAEALPNDAATIRGWVALADAERGDPALAERALDGIPF